MQPICSAGARGRLMPTLGGFAMTFEELNQTFETQYKSWDEISDHELLRILVSLRCAELGAQDFICGGRPTLHEPDRSAHDGQGDPE